MSKHQHMLASTLRRALQAVLSRRLSDPRITGDMTGTEVKVSPDCRHATVLVSIYPEDAEDLTMHGLRSATKHVRRRAGDLVSVSRMPQLRFELDKGLKNQASILQTISEAARTLEQSKNRRAADPQQTNTDQPHPEDAQ